MSQKGLFKQNWHFGGIFSQKRPQGRGPDSQKWVNGEVSGIGTCKFEFSNIQNPYNDIQNGIFDKHQKKPPKRGVF